MHKATGLLRVTNLKVGGTHLHLPTSKLGDTYRNIPKKKKKKKRRKSFRTKKDPPNLASDEYADLKCWGGDLPLKNLHRKQTRTSKKKICIMHGLCDNRE